MNTLIDTPGQNKRARENALQRSRSARIIWAIAAKDIADALRSKTILTIVLTVFFIVALYKLLPMATGLIGTPYGCTTRAIRR